ncbi:multidrug resistance [Fusarium napiforme]|uniref:Multidrug resistance n=1 Tax=Fusarium napiforme TaxID=42672 RepID=A0A8H5N8A8_9HYPO|nr:multidrug resistance [Fusarium napiforme]
MILLWQALCLALPLFISWSTAFPHNIEPGYPDLYSFRHQPYDHIGRTIGERTETDVPSLETQVTDHSTEPAASETSNPSTPTREAQYPVVGPPVSLTTSEALSEVTLSSSAHLPQDYTLSFSPSASEEGDGSTGFTGTLVDSSHPSSKPTTIPLALPTESRNSTETVEVPSSPIPKPSLPTQTSRDSHSARTSGTSASTPDSAEDPEQTHSGRTLEVESTFKTLPTISLFPGDTLTSPLTDDGSTRDFSTTLDTISSDAQTSVSLTTESQWGIETSTSDLTGIFTLPATTAATLVTDTIRSSEQTSTNDKTTPSDEATTVSSATSQVTSAAPSTGLPGDLESSVVSTDVLTPTDTFSKGSFTTMDSSTPSTPAIDTQAPGTTGDSGMPTLTEPETSEPKPSTAVPSPSENTSAISGRTNKGTTEQFQSASSYQASKDGTTQPATHKQSITHAMASNVVVTAGSDAIVTFAPTQDPKFTSLTESTTTTDDNGILVVIWPGGWKWRPVGDKMPATLPSPPKSNPSPVAEPGDEDPDDDDVSTKEAKSTVTKTAPVSTGASTTATSVEPTSETTTSETTAECTATEIPDCTKTMSYITMSESVTITEIGDCPPTPSCATGEQSTVTTTLEPESHWVGYAADPQQGPSEAELDAPVDKETQEYLEDFFQEHDLLLDYEADDASPECSTTSSGLDLTCFSGSWPLFCTHVSTGDNETFVENVTAKVLGSSDKVKRYEHCDSYSIEFSWELGSIDGCVQDCLGAMSKLALSCGLTGSRADGISDSGSLVVGCGIYSYRVVEDYQHTITETTSDVATATSTAESTSSEATTSSSGSIKVTTDELTTTKAVTTSEDAASSTEEADATPTIDPNYQPLVQQDPECLEATDGDHGAIDPGTQDDYAEEFSSQEPDGGWEAGPDIQHSYKETSHGVVYEYKVNWAQDCTTDGDTQDIRWPLGQAADVTAYSLMRGAFEKCNNGGIGGSIQAGQANYTMTVTEVGCMGVKPNMNIMDHTTSEGKILTDAWKTVISKPGGPQRVYWGLESVDPSKVWGFFDFDSVQQHRQFAEEYGADAVKDIPKICTYGEFTKHIKMVPSSDILGSPLTEIILAYFPQDISDQKKETLSSKIQEILRQAFLDDVQVSHAWGVENDFPARSEDGQPRSVLLGFVGFSHSETLGDHQKSDSWKEALLSIKAKTPPESFITTIRAQPSLHIYHGMAGKATSPSGVLEQEHSTPSEPLSSHHKDFDRLDPNRPACFPKRSSELGFICAIVGSIMVSEYFVSGFPIVLSALSDPSNEVRTWPAAVINLTTAILILPFARLAEIHSARLIFLCGHAWLIFWSIIAAFSQDSTMLIACRAMQCLGPPVFLSSSVVIMSRIYRPGPRNTLTFSILGASSCIGFYSGIFFGALSAQVLGWKWYFFIGAFFCTGIFIAGLLAIPKRHGHARHDLEMDWLGTATVVPGVALVVYALTDGGNAAHGYLILILGITCLALFVYVEGWRSIQPFVSAEIFKTNYISRLVVALFVSYGSFSLVLFYASFYIESVLYTGILLTTAWFIPLTAGGFMLALVGGFALHILNGRRLLLILCLGFLGSLILFSIIPDSRISNSFLYWAFIFPAMILGIVGVDITFNIHNFIITTSLPNHLQAVSGALITSLLYLGMAFWLGVIETATSARKEKRAESLDGTSQCQMGFWTGTGLALIFITVQIQSTEADLTADEKA